MTVRNQTSVLLVSVFITSWDYLFHLHPSSIRRTSSPPCALRCMTSILRSLPRYQSSQRILLKCKSIITFLYSNTSKSSYFVHSKIPSPYPVWSLRAPPSPLPISLCPHHGFLKRLQGLCPCNSNDWNSIDLDILTLSFPSNHCSVYLVA